jgi:hypothetical protein
MSNAAEDGPPAQPGGRNDSYHGIVSNPVSLIGHVRASVKLVESAFASDALADNRTSGGRLRPPAGSQGALMGRLSASYVAGRARAGLSSGAVLFRHAVDLDPAPCVHHRQALGGLAEVRKTDAERRQVHRLRQAAQLYPQRSGA